MYELNINIYFMFSRYFYWNILNFVQFLHLEHIYNNLLIFENTDFARTNQENIKYLKSLLIYMMDIFNKKKAQPGNLIKPYYSFRSVHANKVLDIAQEGENKGTATIDKGYAADHQSFAIE